MVLVFSPQPEGRRFDPACCGKVLLRKRTSFLLSHCKKKPKQKNPKKTNTAGTQMKTEALKCTSRKFYYTSDNSSF